MGPLTQAPPRPVYGLELFRLLLQGIYRRPEAPSGIRGCQSLWASEFPASAPCRRGSAARPHSAWSSSPSLAYRSAMRLPSLSICTVTCRWPFRAIAIHPSLFWFSFSTRE